VRALAVVAGVLVALGMHAAPAAGDDPFARFEQPAYADLGLAFADQLEAVMGVPVGDAGAEELYLAAVEILSEIGAATVEASLAGQAAATAGEAETLLRAALDRGLAAMAASIASMSMPLSDDVMRAVLASATVDSTAWLYERMDQVMVEARLDHALSDATDLTRSFSESASPLATDQPDSLQLLLDGYLESRGMAKRPWAGELPDEQPELLLALVRTLVPGDVDDIDDATLAGALASLVEQRPDLAPALVDALAGALVALRPSVADDLERGGLGGPGVAEAAASMRAYLVAPAPSLAGPPREIAALIRSLDVGTLRAQ